jgi:DNA invertase Pin-like site-specific DNA recombinase
MTKVTPEHLARGAYIYVRQSTADQLLHNHESRRRQYGLADRARSLGWQEVVVIDDDLGRSGSGVSRPGFERLLAAICEGRVGGVLAIEASRLARNGRDWHTLIEFCGLVGTIILDEDGVYDPRHPNDRLLLILDRGRFCFVFYPSLINGLAIRVGGFALDVHLIVVPRHIA